MDEEKKSSTGLDPNVAGTLSYVLGWVTGLIFFLIEERDEFIRFHAMQSIVTFGAVTAAHIALGFLRSVPYAGVPFAVLQPIAALLTFVLWVVLMVKAYQREWYKLPWAGDLAERYSAKR